MSDESLPESHNSCTPDVRSPLRLVRVLEGVSQRTLGEKIGKSQSWISRLESGLIHAGPTERVIIARTLQMPTDMVFPGEGQE